jgi:LCP family protein required for cell wall assembly
MAVSGAGLEQDEYGYTNILLLGQGNEDHDGKDLTDTIIVASIDPKETNSVVLLSLPRDLYFLKTEKMGKGRLNSMFRDYRGYLRHKGKETEEASLETMEELAAEIGRSLGLEMHGAIKVNFTAFTEAVDAIGGIEINVPYDIIDPEYPDENFGFDPFEIYAGLQKLDGATALKYARSRHTTSDFGRSQRQQQLIAAIGQKAKEQKIYKSPNVISEFVSIFRENVETTFSMRELIGLAELAEKVDRENIIAMQLNDRNALYDSFIEPGGLLYTPPRDQFDGASVLLPVSIPEFPVTWKQIQAFSSILFSLREVHLKKPKISVLNAGASPGMARKLGTELTRFGFDVDLIANASIEKRDHSTVSPLGETEQELSAFFADLLQIEDISTPADLPADEQRDIIIIIGRNFRFAPIQNLLSPSQK